MRKSILGVFAVALLLCFGARNASAQDGKISLFGGYSYGTSNFGCGFGDFGCGIDPALHGYALSATYNFTKHFGMEANFTGHNGTPQLDYSPATTNQNGFSEPAGQDIYTYTFGPKVSLPMGNFTLFTHFLVGGQHVHEGVREICLPAAVEGCTGGVENSFKMHGNGMAFKTGAGADWNHGRWGVRILEVDYIHSEPFTTFTEGCSDCSTQPESFNVTGNNFELSTGIKFNFGMTN